MNVRCQAKRIRKSDRGRQVWAEERPFVLDGGSKTQHRRRTSGVKSFQINRSVCEAELFELSSVDGRRACSGEIVFCLCERPVTLREGDERLEEALEEENLVEGRDITHAFDHHLLNRNAFRGQEVEFGDTRSGGVAILDSLLKVNKQSLGSLLLILKQGGYNSRFGSVRVLQFIVVNAESKILVAEKEGVVTELLKSVMPNNDPALIEAALVSFGAVRALSRLLAEVELGAATVEKVLKLVEAVSSTREVRKEICEDATCMTTMLRKVLKVCGDGAYC
ncbi:hypothetical protein LR48_Vigan02g078100 [Vigna angularis]|uniref:U-box domain-containing protein n=1 Tax=Phaseolus angularis TaxID=3914 RepID=A0A0L9TVX5_PHAAN|nr:hypothetical protein LR48_Vigan02g078100 [Vigna angularis]